jgi:hypothetical protein
MLTQVESLGKWKIYKDTVTEQHIRERAYFKWLEADCPCGRDDEFWLSAEGELLKPNFPTPPIGMDVGYFYSPYVPEEFKSPVVDEKPVDPVKGLLTRYGKKLLEKIRGKNGSDS